MLAFAARSAVLAQPPDLAKRAAERESQAQQARSNYTYRQSVWIQEMPAKGAGGGEYREVRDIIFSPAGERTERFVGKPIMNLARLRLTEEDFRDIREVQPFLFTTDVLWLYETKFRGEETVNGIDCWLLEVRPRQVLQGMRLFQGTLWINKRDYSTIRTDGVAVPQIMRRKEENLFPHFVTERQLIDGYWFPVLTGAEETLPFSSGPIRMRMRIEYSNYQRFSASSTVTFEQEKK
jgi:hypothetical protein